VQHAGDAVVRILFQMAPALAHGTRKERVECSLAIAAWFCMGAFISSVVAFYADSFLSADLSGSAPAIVGGALTAVFASIKSA
jgi:hypothetical protein